MKVCALNREIVNSGFFFHDGLGKRLRIFACFSCMGDFFSDYYYQFVFSPPLVKKNQNSSNFSTKRPNPTLSVWKPKAGLLENLKEQVVSTSLLTHLPTFSWIWRPFTFFFRSTRRPHFFSDRTTRWVDWCHFCIEKRRDCQSVSPPQSPTRLTSPPVVTRSN